jgi:hypothetical protein
MSATDSSPRTIPPHNIIRVGNDSIHRPLVGTREAAAVLGRSPNTIKRWRYEGVGPDYVEIAGRVRYDVAVLEEYIRQNTRTPSVRAALETARGTR